MLRLRKSNHSFKNTAFAHLAKSSLLASSRAMQNQVADIRGDAGRKDLEEMSGIICLHASYPSGQLLSDSIAIGGERQGLCLPFANCKQQRKFFSDSQLRAGVTAYIWLQKLVMSRSSLSIFQERLPPTPRNQKGE